jgi:opacity protein-like surface antigen
MKQERVLGTLALLLATMGLGLAAEGQHPTAVQPVQLSVFGGVTGVYTGLGGGKNFSVTAGGDIALPPVFGVRPTIELRGTYPTDRGLVDNQRSVLAGLRVDFLLGHRWHPYGDVLFGRGQINYTPYGYRYINPDGTQSLYVLSTTYVYSAGGGFDYDLGDRWGIKVDAQLQRWGETNEQIPPVPTPSGLIYPKVGTVGIVYRFGFNH